MALLLYFITVLVSHVMLRSHIMLSSYFVLTALQLHLHLQLRLYRVRSRYYAFKLLHYCRATFTLFYQCESYIALVVRPILLVLWISLYVALFTLHVALLYSVITSIILA